MATSQGLINTALIKANQIGTLYETILAMLVALGKGHELVVSHRSKSPNDDMEAQIALSVNSLGTSAGTGEAIHLVDKLVEQAEHRELIDRHPEFFEEIEPGVYSFTRAATEAKVAAAPGIGFGEYGDNYVRFGLIENEHRTRQAVRGIRDMLRKVVTEGTASFGEVAGYHVGGKTGTADKPKPQGGYYEDKVIATFASAFPMTDPKYVLVVTLDEPVDTTGKEPRRTAGWNIEY